MFSLIIYIIIAAIGFMMVYLYKQTNTTAKLFKPDPKRLLRIFLVVLSVATVITFSLSLLTNYEMGASNIPDESKMAFNNVKSVMLLSINFSFFILIVLANTYSLARKKLAVLPYVLTLVFYAMFILNDFLLLQKFIQVFKGNLPDFHTTGWIKVGLGSAVTLLNAGMIWWGLRKP